jgi:hypothetical protein
MVRPIQYQELSGIIKELTPVLDAAAIESGFELKTNHEHLAKTWTALLQQGIGKGYVASVNEKVKGILLGLIFPDSLTGHLRGQECLWAVDKTSRRHSLDLLNHFEFDCKRAGCHDVVCTATTGPTIERMRRLYAKLGYHPVAEAFSIKM